MLLGFVRRHLASGGGGSARANADASLKSQLYQTPLKTKLLRCNSPLEIRTLFANQGATVANALTCTSAIKRLGELKNASSTSQSPSTTSEEVKETLDAIYYNARRQKEFPPREIARFLHKIALLGAEFPLPPFMLDRLRDLKSYDEFTPVELSNLAWTMAKYKRVEDELWFERCEATLLARTTSNASLLEDFSPENRSNLLWSFAILRRKPSAELIDKFARAPRDAKAFKLQALVNFLWALAKFSPTTSEMDVSDLFDELKSRSLSKLRVQSLANLIWAQARLGQGEDEELTQKLVNALLVQASKDGSFSPMSLSNTLVGLARVKRGAWWDSAALKPLLQQAIKQQQQQQQDIGKEEEEEVREAIMTLGLEVS